MNKLALQVYNFLTANKTIDRINFEFEGLTRKYKVYPSAYKSDVATKIRNGVILVEKESLGFEERGNYKLGGWNHDTLVLDNIFSLLIPSHQGTLIHECTHAHIDIQNIGGHSKFEDEGTAWVAEAVYLSALGKYSTGTSKLKMVCQDAAIQILNGKYYVGKNYTEPIMKEVAKVYGTRTTKLYSNGVWRIKVKCN